jgi:PAS domain S-box-containing protein
MRSQLRLLPARIAGLYLVFGLAWILVTDQGLSLLDLDHRTETLIQSWKGSAFALASAALIFLLLRRGMDMIRRQSQQLYRSEQRYRLLFENNPHPICLVDTETLAFLAANQVVVDSLGYSSEELKTKTVTELLVEEDQPRLAILVERLRRDNTATTGRWRVRDKQEAVRTFDVVSQPMTLAGRRVHLIQGKEATAQLAAEASLIDLSRQLASVSAEMHDIGQAAAHQLQQPLRQVVSHLQLLARHCHGLDGDAREYLSYAIDGALRMKTTLDDVVELTGMDPEPPTPTNLGRVIDDVVQALQPRLMTTGGQVHVGPLPVLAVRERHLRLVFHHLLDNAIKFRHPERPPDIHITAQPTDHGWCFRVTDQGIGIPPEHHLNIFGAFRRGHGDLSMPGNGIGLAVCKKVIEQHGGTIGVESRPGFGSTFYFTLPKD